MAKRRATWLIHLSEECNLRYLGETGNAAAAATTTVGADNKVVHTQHSFDVRRIESIQIFAFSLATLTELSF